MSPDQEISALNAIIDRILVVLEESLQSGEELPEDLQVDLANELASAGNRIEELQAIQRDANAPAPIEPPMTAGSDLIWILAGGNPDAFVNYLRTFPDPALNALIRNPEALQSTIERLQRTMPQGRQEAVAGIPHADLNSSNIYGFKYDPQSNRLLVRFQGGSIYGYSGVPAGVFNVFQQGAVPAKTSGQNQFGTWWRGKIPSLGAAFYEMIRNGGYPYQKLT